MTDDVHVRAAIAHWAPRLIANGIDYNDFQTTTARIRTWRDWSTEWSRMAAAHETLAEEAEARAAPVSAADAWVRAALCHHFGKFVWFEDTEQYRRAGAATVADYRRAADRMRPPAERIAVPYAATELPGYLRRPRTLGPPPVALIISGLDSVKEEMNALERQFHCRGMATLSIDGPGQGESETLPIEPEFEKVIAATLDWLAGRDDVDSDRIGVVGISLGGYYSARAAAFEPRLVCAVSVGGPYDFGEILPAMPALSQQAFCVRSLAPDLAHALDSGRALTLAGAASRIAMPFLIVTGSHDRLIPVAQAERLYAEIPHPAKELRVLEGGNHVCNNMPYRWRPHIADWMGRYLRAEPPYP